MVPIQDIRQKMIACIWRAPFFNFQVSNCQTWRVGALVFVFIVVAAILATYTVPAAAADDASSSFVTPLPDNGNSQQKVFLFVLKKNGLTIRMQPDDFCQALGYGEAVKPTNGQGVFWDIDEYGSDGKKPGSLNWVICRFNVKPKQ
jgi:hypothetical protein